MQSADRLDLLSERELSSVALIADGLSNEAIAARLHVSVKTVESTCTSAFRKLGLVEGPGVNRRVLAAVLYRDAARGRTVVPMSTGGLVGRDDLLDELRARMQSGGVVSLVGAGGIGKTRVAAELSRSWRDGTVRWVSLVGTTSADSAWAALAEAFALMPAPAAAMRRRLGRVLIDDPGLVVIDNAEPVAAAVADMVTTLCRLGATRILVSVARRSPPPTRS